MKITFPKHGIWRILIIAFLSFVAVYVLLVQTFFLIVVYKESHWENHHPISGKLGYYRSAKGGYIYDLATNEILIPSVDWVVEPKGNDSIGIFHWRDKRGYFNANSGEIISQPQYEAAWIFRNGVGGVAENDSVFFIGLDGNPINDKKFPRIKGEDYVYNGDYCIMKVGGKYGAINKLGEWIIKPEWDYAEVQPNGLLTAWQNGWAVTVYEKDSIMPFPNQIEIVGDTIYSRSDSLRIYIRHTELE